MKKLKVAWERLKDLYRKVNALTGGVLGMLREAIESFGDAYAPQAAASMAYYTIFSLFPMLLVFVTIASFFLTSEQAYREVVNFIQDIIPVSQGLIERNVRQVLKSRGTIGLVALLGLLWSSSSVFTLLAHHINLAWSEAETRNFLQKRLVGMGMVAVFGLLLLLSLVSTTVLDLLPRFELFLIDGAALHETFLWKLVSAFVPWFFSFLMFFVLYRWTPNTDVEWRPAFLGALIAAVGWRAATNVLSWAVSSGFTNYELVYGSLGTIVALMFWAYLTGWIALFGAHLSAAISKHFCD